MTASKIVLNAASGVGGAGLDVEEVFSTYNYTGNASTQTITNGIDLAGEGGLVWFKNRSSGSTNHSIFDTASGATGGTRLRPNLSNGLQAFNGSAVFTTSATGFALNNDASNDLNDSSYNYVSWTFRKAEKWFDIQTYTGNGASSRAISHNLNSTPGMIIIKQTSGSGENWIVWHRSISNVSNGDIIYLNATDSKSGMNGKFDGANLPTSTTFTIEQDNSVNASGATYVAYLFAHNDGDGDFGPDGDADIIKCGSYTGNGSTNGPEIDLGFEPQWVMLKRTDSTADWVMQDVMRGMIMDSGGAYIKANDSAAEFSTTGYIQPEPTGFKVRGTGSSQANASGGNYIYIAIRRGTKVPESATEVFNIDTYGGTSPNPPAWTSGFPVDMALWKAVNSASYSTWNAARLISGKYLQTAATNAELSMASHVFDYQNGWNSDTGSNSNSYSWMWKRAPNYMDVVAFTGTGSAGTHNHNLTIPAEMMWVKSRAGNGNWFVYHSGLGATKYLFLNETSAAGTASSVWNDTAPTSSVFSVGASVNQASASIAYLFASLDGISKVGSYTGNGSTQTIDCGFSAGARFVLIKKTNGSGSWLVFDTERGIVSGNDPYLELNETATQNSTTDYMDPDNSGFVLTQNGLINGSSDTYIFYAIA